MNHPSCLPRLLPLLWGKLFCTRFTHVNSLYAHLHVATFEHHCRLEDSMRPILWLIGATARQIHGTLGDEYSFARYIMQKFAPRSDWTPTDTNERGLLLRKKAKLVSPHLPMSEEEHPWEIPTGLATLVKRKVSRRLSTSGSFQFSSFGSISGVILSRCFLSYNV